MPTRILVVSWAIVKPSESSAARRQHTESASCQDTLAHRPSRRLGLCSGEHGPGVHARGRARCDLVEFDLQLTKDRQIVCLHDNSLERTTDVEEVFPDRFRPGGEGPQATRRWMIDDFTLAELKRLDAGAWFDPKFRGTKIPTFAETMTRCAGGRASYRAQDSGAIPGHRAAHPRRARGQGPCPARRGSTDPSAAAVVLGCESSDPLRDARHQTARALPRRRPRRRAVADGRGPDEDQDVRDRYQPGKSDRWEHAEAMARAREMGLLITPYTFRASAVTGFPDVRAEMAHYLQVLGVDGVITDNPDQMPPSQPRR